MTNKDFEDHELNHNYREFYLQAIISLHSAFLERGCSASNARQYAIEEAQLLMLDMGYTNNTKAI